MVQIRDEPDAEMLDNLLSRRKKNVRLTAFTSSATLILSWPFPLVILCFQTNQNRIFDPRIYATLSMAYLLSGFFRRVFLRRVLSPSFLTTIMPAILGLLGNSVFMTALYKGQSWNWISIFFMFSSRICFGWSTYSAEDFNRRARNKAKETEESERARQRVDDMAPDLQDIAFHAGVLVAMGLCFILEVCLKNLGPQMAEFYSMLILSGFSLVLSFVSLPCLHVAVNGLIKVETEQWRQRQAAEDDGTRSTGNPSHTGDEGHSNTTGLANRMVAQVTTFRNKYLVSTIFRSAFGPLPYPPGQLAMTFASALLTSATILFDYLLLPYLIVYLRRPLISSDYFPFPDFLFAYTTLFCTELLVRHLLLGQTTFVARVRRLSTSKLIGALTVVSAVVAVTTPVMLYSTGVVLNVGSTALYGFLLFLLCVGEGLMKSGHVLFGGVLFVRYYDTPRGVPLSVAQSGEQLLGILRCLFTAFLFIIAGAVIYHQRFIAGLTMLSMVTCLALSAALIGLTQVIAMERKFVVRVTMPD